MRKCIPIIFFLAITLTISNHLSTYGESMPPDTDQQKQDIDFSDNQKEPVPVLYTGEKAESIHQNMNAIFVPCSVAKRKKAEKNLVELVSTLKLPEQDSVAVDRTWSSPLNFATPGSRRAVIAFLHTGTGHYVSLWILSESENDINCYSFQGSEKGCGTWQVCSDLDGDKNPEIIIKHFVGDYDGANTIAVWSAIYQWDGNNYVRADDMFPDYYAREVVLQYQKILIERKDWENHTDQQKHRIYQKCKYVLERAESISKKAGSNTS